MPDPESTVDMPSGVPPWPDRPQGDHQFGGETNQLVKAGGQYVIEYSQAAAVTGRDHGYLSRTQSAFAIAGCTCGWFADGPASEVKPAFEAHPREHP